MGMVVDGGLGLRIGVNEWLGLGMGVDEWLGWGGGLRRQWMGWKGGSIKAGVRNGSVSGWG